MPVDSFRGLFYKGDGGETGRTPSAWLRPHSNRITLRVTTESEPDVGADSKASLAAGTWSHLAFSFENNPSEGFSATIYINGTLDISVAFNGTSVVGNDGPLHIGRDPSNFGPRLVRLLREHFKHSLRAQRRLGNSPLVTLIACLPGWSIRRSFKIHHPSTLHLW